MGKLISLLKATMSQDMNLFKIKSRNESNGTKKLCGDYTSKYYLEKFIDDLKLFFKYEV